MLTLLPVFVARAAQVVHFTETYENTIDRFRRIFSNGWTDLSKLKPLDEEFLLSKSKILWDAALSANLDPVKNPAMRGPNVDPILLIRYWVTKDIDRIRQCYEFCDSLKLSGESGDGPRFALSFGITQEASDLIMRVGLLDDEVRKKATLVKSLKRSSRGTEGLLSRRG